MPKGVDEAGAQPPRSGYSNANRTTISLSGRKFLPYAHLFSPVVVE
jgi:hypothetical protein